MERNTGKYPNAPGLRPSYDLFRTFGRTHFERYDRLYGPLVEGKKEGTALDVGCGFGSDFMLWLRERAGFTGKMIHLDATPFVLGDRDVPAELKYRREDDVRLCADAQALPLPDNSVGIVHQQGMLCDIEGLVDERQVFREVHRVLKPNGFYVINELTGPTRADGFFKITGDPIYTCGLYQRVEASMPMRTFR